MSMLDYAILLDSGQFNRSVYTLQYILTSVNHLYNEPQ